MKYYSVVEKKGIPFPDTDEPGGPWPSERSLAQKDDCHVVSPVASAAEPSLILQLWNAKTKLTEAGQNRGYGAGGDGARRC